MLGKAGLLAALGVVCIVSGGCKDDDKAKRKAKERALASLPYMNSYPVTEPKTATMNGVTVNKGASVQDGLNLFGHCGGASSTATKAAPVAVLLNQSGKIIHQWSSEVGVPVGDELDFLPEWFKCWQVMELTPDGDLLVLSGEKLLKLDWDSNVVWQRDDYFHHEIHQSHTGDIYALASKPIFLQGRDLTIADNHVVALSPQGDEKWRISLYDILSADEEIASRLDKRIAESFEMVAKSPETLEEWNKGKKLGSKAIWIRSAAKRRCAQDSQSGNPGLAWGQGWRPHCQITPSRHDSNDGTRPDACQ